MTMENGIPSAVTQQDKAADALIQGTPAQIVAPQIPQVQPPVEPAAAPQAPVVFPAPAQSPAPMVPTTAAPVDYQQQYLVLQGKYNAETAAMRNQITTLTEQIRNMSGLMASLKKEPTTPITPTLDPSKYKDMGEEMMDLVTQLNAARNEIAQLKGTQVKLGDNLVDVQQTVATDARSRYFNALDNAVPDWEVINDHPVFHQFLMQPDGFTGRTLNDTIGAASEALDAAVVIKIFQAYKDAQQPAVPSPAAATTTPATTPVAPAVHPSQLPGSGLLGQMVPDIGPAAPINTTGQPAFPVVTRDQYKVYSTNHALGRVSVEEFANITANFQKSIAAGLA